MRILAIDQGTSATKAIVVVDGVVAAEAERACAPTATPDGGVEVDPELLWQSVLGAGRDALAKAGGRVPDAIGLANQGETILAWDRTTGQPMSNCIVWQDRRSTALCDALRAQGWAERLAQITGLELDPYFVAPKIAWLRDRVAVGATITTSDVWLLHRLCGAFVTDAATASRSLLLDLDTVTWSPIACEAFGIDLESLPSIVHNAGVVGETTAFSTKPVPITGLCVDQQAALYAESCVAAGEAKCTYGTGAFLLASTGHAPTRSTNGLVGCVAWQIDNGITWCLDGQVFTVGAAVTWLQEVGFIDSPGDLDRLGGTVATPEGVTFVPGLAGLGAPFWAPQAKGALTGLSLGTSRAHVVRAVIEGIAAQVTWLARAAGSDLGKPLVRLRVDGGLTRSTVLLQTQADLLQAPIEVYPSPNATALGVAAFAQLGAGGKGTLHKWRPSAVIEPKVSGAEADARLHAWRAVAEATLGLDG
jgi:glycerol kinase